MGAVDVGVEAEVAGAASGIVVEADCAGGGEVVGAAAEGTAACGGGGCA